MVNYKWFVKNYFWEITSLYLLTVDRQLKRVLGLALAVLGGAGHGDHLGSNVK